eukprot:1742004-Pyramimonas_sp.AAC.2
MKPRGARWASRGGRFVLWCQQNFFSSRLRVGCYQEMTLEEYKKQAAETKAALMAKFNLQKTEKVIAKDADLEKMSTVAKPDPNEVFFVGKTEEKKAKAKVEAKKKVTVDTGFIIPHDTGRPEGGRGGRGGRGERGRGDRGGRGGGRGFSGRGGGRGGGRGYAGANINVTDLSAFPSLG